MNDTDNAPQPESPDPTPVAPAPSSVAPSASGVVAGDGSEADEAPPPQDVAADHQQ